MREGGTVKEVNGEVAVVALKRTQACVHCSGCGAFTATGPDVILVEAKNEVGAQPGDDVDLEMEPGTVYSAALMLYGVPLVMGIAGYALGRLITGGDSGGLLGALVLMLLAYFVVREWDRRLAGSEKLRPTIVAVIGRGGSREDENC